MDRFSPAALLHVLHEHQVAFIAIGGIAAIAHGSPSLTRDLDVCYERSRDNLQALARALQSVHATLRGAPPDIPFKLDARTLEMGDHFTFSTDLGDFDCLGIPSGTNGYGDLFANAVEVESDGVKILVAGLDDLIRMKRAAGRPRDRAEIEILGALRDVVDREDG